MDATARTSLSPDHGEDNAPDIAATIAGAVGATWRWRWRFAAAFCAVVALGLLLLVALPLRYTAHATIMIGTRPPPITLSGVPTSAPRREPDVDGGIEVLSSFPSLKRVIDGLDLVGQDSFRSVRKPVEPGLLERLHERLARLTPWPGTRPDPDAIPRRTPPTPEEQAAVLLRRNLKMDRIGRSALVDIAYSDSNPRLAAGIANALADNAARGEDFTGNLTASDQPGFDVVAASIVARAGVPWSPSSPRPVMILVPALILALGAAVSVVAVSEYRVRRLVLGSADVISRGLQPLALIPRVHDSPRDSGKQAPQVDPFGDAVAGLDVPLSLLRRDSRSALVVLFTSPLVGAGTSSIVVELGQAMATSGRRVLLIDAVFRPEDPARGSILDPCPDPPGPAAHGCGAMQPVRRTGLPNLDRVGVGDPLKQPLAVLRSSHFNDAVEEWRKSYDFILVNTPPVLVSVEARLLGLVTDCTVLVVQWRRTRWDAVQHALRLLSEGGASMAGLVVSKVDFAKLGRLGLTEGRTYGGML